MEPALWTIGSVVFVSVLSLVGIVFLSLKEKTLQSVLIYMVSFSAGALFGGAFMHLLPEASEAGFTMQISATVLLGVIVFFVVEKLVHWHHCHLPSHRNQPKRFAYMNLVGDGVHNFIDGLVIAGSYVAAFPVGVATTLAVILHEIPQEVSDFGVLVHGGFSRRKALGMNFLSAITAIVGGVVGLFIASAGAMIPMMLAFAAGGFIYVAGVDLIPELHKKFEARSSVLQLAVFIVGVALMYGLKALG